MLKNPRNFHRSQNTSGHLSYSCFFSIKPCLVMVEMVLKTGAEMKKCAKIQPSKKIGIVWFEGSVNHNVYLEKVLKEAVWNSLKSTATRKQIWFQQDGASCHVTPACLDFLKSKFGTRVISRKTEHIWPPYSPDLSPMDFSFWSYVLSHVIRCQPATIQELKMIVSDFISNMEPDYLRKIARQTRRRAEFCVSQNGSHFEHLLKKKYN